jgi:hypothetical protein
LVGDGHADSVIVEGPSAGAGQTLLVLPVPRPTAQIGGLGSVRGGIHALSLNYVVAEEAGQAVA